MTPLVTVLLPVHNGSHYLDETIQSVCSQTFNDFEFVIVNDASDDDSLIKLTQLKDIDQRVKLYTNPKKSGLVKSLNLGLLYSRGMYVARIDSDDIWEKQKLRTQIDYLRLHPETSILGTQVSFLNKNGMVLGKSDFPISRDGIGLWLLRGKNPFIHSSVVFKRGCFYNENFDCSEDIEMFTRLYFEGSAANLNDHLTHYRILRQSYNSTTRAATLYYCSYTSRYFMKRLQNLPFEMPLPNQKLYSNRLFSFLYWHGTLWKLKNKTAGKLILVLACLFCPRLFYVRARTAILSFLFLPKWKRTIRKIYSTR